MVGYKYFYPAYTADPLHSFDVPMYMMEAIFAAAGRENVENFTSEITGLPDGIRMRVYTPKEIAWAEYSATKSADVLLNLFDALEVGGQELETSRYGKIDFTPVCMYSLVNFGAFNLSLGLRSPDDSILNLGDPCGLCYGARGSLTSVLGSQQAVGTTGRGRSRRSWKISICRFGPRSPHGMKPFGLGRPAARFTTRL